VKQLILLPFLLLVTGIFAQPKLVGSLTYSGAREGGSVFRIDLPGSTPGVIHSFDNFAPHKPLGGVCAGDADWLYGAMQFTGTDNQGALYRIKQDGTAFTPLMNFNNPFGISLPYYHTDGKIYVSNEFKLKVFDPATNATSEYNYNAGIYVRNLLIDANDWVYLVSGTHVLSKMKTDGTQWTDLHTFNVATEGSFGTAGVTEIPGDILFGVQKYDGASAGGTLYSINKDGTNFTVHHQFSDASGIYPESKLVYFDGKLFGTTQQGGNFGIGVLYSIDTDGTNYRVLHHFETGAYGNADVFGNISITSNGRIFGSFNQFYSQGSTIYRLFKVDTSGDNFEPIFTNDQRESGHFNQDILLLNDENIFVPTAEMGRHDGGVFNSCDTLGFSSGLFHFGYSANGFRPSGGLIKSTNGKLYGITKIGGTAGNGTIFTMNADGTGYTKLHEFTDAEGYDPSGKLLEASDGKLYGACKIGGPINTGCLYRIDKNGSNFQIIYTFNNLAQGYWPLGSLVEDATGALYGITTSSTFGYGTIFKINKDGSNYTILREAVPPTDFFNPVNGLILQGGYLYASYPYGGANGNGGILRIKTDGTGYQVLHAFAGADGAQPIGAPIIANNGKLYGTTANGGTNNNGVVFSMDVTGANFTVLRHFLVSVEGSYPQEALIQASDGLLYGTTAISSSGGSSGNIFKLNLDGSNFTVLKEFNLSTEGQFPSALLDLNGSVALPVTWLSFTAQTLNQSVELNWQTAREQENDHFEIERSATGNSYHTIGSVPGSMNATSTKSYAFTDNDPLTGISYYRIKQVDLNGQSSYSRIAQVKFTGKTNITIGPNPVNDRLYIQSGSEKITAVQITDAMGRMVLQKRSAGNSTSISVPVQSLPGGLYWLQIHTTHQTWRKPFMKQ
jgi:uncharacterized repeat protein (TIGR03803 family)